MPADCGAVSRQDLGRIRTRPGICLRFYNPSLKTADRTPKHQILIVEDDSADVFLISEAITLANLEADLKVVTDGDKAIRFFEQVDSDDSIACPALVILDINLPRKNGSQVLQQMRTTRRCANALVLVVSSSDSAKDRDVMAKLGANGYFRKPSDYDQFMKLGGLVKNLLGEAPN